MIVGNMPMGIIESVGGVAYDPGMMTFDGATGYYSITRANTGNLETAVVRFNIASFSGGGDMRVVHVTNNAATPRLLILVYSNDHATTELRGKALLLVKNNSNVEVCRFLSSSVVTDGTDKVIFASFDGNNGTAIYYLDGVDTDDSGYSLRTAPTTGTLPTISSAMRIGANAAGADSFVDGDIGYVGYSNTYLTNPTDFYHPTNGLQELDESGWTEWGAQPLFWNQYGTMTVNNGSAGNMTANGTITGPA